MQAGKLNRNIMIETLGEWKTPTGAVVRDWSHYRSVKAEVVPPVQVEYATGFGTAQSTRIVFRIRWISGWSMQTTLRVYCEGETFDVKEVHEIGRRRGLELHCERSHRTACT